MQQHEDTKILQELKEVLLKTRSGKSNDKNINSELNKYVSKEFKSKLINQEWPARSDRAL
jgi:hypothetical protein